MGTESFEYVLSTCDGTSYACGVGRDGLLKALELVLDGDKPIKTGVIERGRVPFASPDEWEGEVIAVIDSEGLMGLGPIGQFWTTRALKFHERMTLRHIGPVIMSVDIAQAEVHYSFRDERLRTKQCGRSSRGLENATRYCLEQGYGFIVRKVAGVPGEQMIACYTEAGFFFTMCADERERHAIIETRILIENFGDAPPTLDISDPTFKPRLLESLRSIAGKSVKEQARISQKLLGRAHALAAAMTPLLVTSIASP